MWAGSWRSLECPTRRIGPGAAGSKMKLAAGERPGNLGGRPAGLPQSSRQQRALGDCIRSVREVMPGRRETTEISEVGTHGVVKSSANLAGAMLRGVFKVDKVD